MCFQSTIHPYDAEEFYTPMRRRFPKSYLNNLKYWGRGMVLLFYFYFSQSCSPPPFFSSLLYPVSKFYQWAARKGWLPPVYLLKIGRSNHHCAHKSCGCFGAHFRSLLTSKWLIMKPKKKKKKKRKIELIKGQAVVKWKWWKMKGLPSTSKAEPSRASSASPWLGGADGSVQD